MSDELYLPTDVKTWFDGLGAEFFRKLGFHENQIILDFGSRVGNYSIPIAEIVGENGKVFALDVDHEALDELMDRADHYRLSNIHPMKTEGELVIELPDSSIDGILFYDVIYPICKREGIDAYKKILLEFKRLLKKGGIVSILFAHLEALDLTIDEVIELTMNEFEFIGEIEHITMHWNNLKKGKIHNFKRK